MTTTEIGMVIRRKELRRLVRLCRAARELALHAQRGYPDALWCELDTALSDLRAFDDDGPIGGGYQPRQRAGTPNPPPKKC